LITVILPLTVILRWREGMTAILNSNLFYSSELCKPLKKMR
jgi:hypothetical protein